MTEFPLMLMWFDEHMSKLDGKVLQTHNYHPCRNMDEVELKVKELVSCKNTGFITLYEYRDRYLKGYSGAEEIDL